MVGQSFLTTIDRKFPWSFLGFIIGLSGLAFGIYSIFFYEKKPDFRVDVSGNAPVISLQEDVPNLEVLFNGQDIRKSKQALSLLTLSIGNRGNLAITTTDFDSKDPFKIIVKDSRVIRADLLKPSTDYFNKVIEQLYIVNDCVNFPAFIIESNQFFGLKLLILHPEGITPEIHTQGVIAKVGSIIVTQSFRESLNLNNLSSAFSGDVRVQSIRIGAYGLTFTILLIGIFILYIYLADKITENIRIKRRIGKGEEWLSTCDESVAQQLRAFVYAYSYADYKSVGRLRDRLERGFFANGKNRKELRRLLQALLMTSPQSQWKGIDTENMDYNDLFVEKLTQFIKFIGNN